MTFKTLNCNHIGVNSALARCVSGALSLYQGPWYLSIPFLARDDLLGSTSWTFFPAADFSALIVGSVFGHFPEALSGQ